MKNYVFGGLILFSAVSAVLAFPAYGESGKKRPFCYDVDVQINQDNNSNVKQDCERNYNRTSQVGKNNSASTEQGGDVNSDTTRQYEYNASPRR